MLLRLRTSIFETLMFAVSGAPKTRAVDGRVIPLSQEATRSCKVSCAKGLMLVGVGDGSVLLDSWFTRLNPLRSPHLGLIFSLVADVVRLDCLSIDVT